VVPANRRAIGCYERLGFAEVLDAGTVRYLGRSTA